MKQLEEDIFEALSPIHSLVAQLLKNSPAMQETPGSIPGSGRSTGEGIGYPLQYSWASLSWLGGGSAGKESDCNAGDLGLIPGLGRSLKKGMATHSSILACRIPRTV